MMRYQNRAPAGEVPESVEAPTKCPACASSHVKTTSKVVSAASYWRCEDCGEVWNVARLSAASRYTNAWGSFRR